MIASLHETGQSIWVAEDMMMMLSGGPQAAKLHYFGTGEAHVIARARGMTCFVANFTVKTG